VTARTYNDMSLPKNHLELLSPARDVAIAREAILHGADAIYIGGPSFGARHNACNEVSDIAELVEFARRYHARVFTTINTILHDNELEPARKLIHQLYDAGVDALIVQDLGVMELDIPPSSCTPAPRPTSAPWSGPSSSIRPVSPSWCWPVS
jgi:Collagenase and related proteases